MNKFAATTPDGTHTATRGSKADYTFASWVHATGDAGQGIMGFHKTQAAALTAARGWANRLGGTYGVVPVTKIK